MIDWKLQTDIWKRFAKPLEYVAWFAILGTLLVSLFLQNPTIQNIEMLGVFLFTAIYILLFFHWILPVYGIHPWMNYLIAFNNVAIVGAYSYLLDMHGLSVNFLYILVIALSGIMSGQLTSFFAAAFAFIADYTIGGILRGFDAALLIPKIYNFLIYLLSAYTSSTLGKILHSQAVEAMQESKNLALLLDASLATSNSLDLNLTLPQLTEKIIRGLPASFCRIDILDEEGECLVLSGINAQRGTQSLNLATKQITHPNTIPLIAEVLHTRKTRTIQQKELLEIEDSISTFSNFIPSGMKSICLLPLISADHLVGLITIGEARNWQREPICAKKTEILHTLASQIAMVAYNAFLNEQERRNSEQLRVINQVAQVIGSTIELEELLEKIYQLLSQVMICDTYYVGLYLQDQNALELRILIDGGQRFPSTRLITTQGLVSQVIKYRRPFMVRHLSAERETLPVKPAIVGKDKHSESWLGVPMMAGNELVGIIAVASYSPLAFNENDKALLINVANQSAVALDNARHHAEVELQARTDSLTMVLNHGSFLESLEDLVQKSNFSGDPISLIMLDIDNFKEYNDIFGHVLGDEVLSLVAQSMKACINDSHVIGRWGGEEFGIILPNTTIVQATEIAERIRYNLSDMAIHDKQGVPIPKPTISQGIATIPTHAKNTNQLVQKADQALYVAKNKGRDQIRIWDKN